MKFIKNNIEFRQVSSQAQANFMSSKSFMLNEVLQSKKHVFSATSKEVLLQTYKIWTDLLVKAEEFCVLEQKVHFDKSSFDYLFEEAASSLKDLEHHLVEHKTWFDPMFVDVWLKIQNSRKDLIIDSIKDQTLNQLVPEAYNNMSMYLMSFMNHILFTLHEIDYLLYSRGTSNFLPFVYISTVDVNFNKLCGKCASAERLDIYLKEDLLGTKTLEMEDDIFRNSYNDITSEIESRDIQIKTVV
jgi:hypothetical protein